MVQGGKTHAASIHSGTRTMWSGMLPVSIATTPKINVVNKGHKTSCGRGDRGWVSHLRFTALCACVGNPPMCQCSPPPRESTS